MKNGYTIPSVALKAYWRALGAGIRTKSPGVVKQFPDTFMVLACPMNVYNNGVHFLHKGLSVSIVGSTLILGAHGNEEDGEHFLTAGETLVPSVLFLEEIPLPEGISLVLLSSCHCGALQPFTRKDGVQVRPVFADAHDAIYPTWGGWWMVDSKDREFNIPDSWKSYVEKPFWGSGGDWNPRTRKPRCPEAAAFIKDLVSKGGRVTQVERQEGRVVIWIKTPEGNGFVEVVGSSWSYFKPDPPRRRRGSK